MRNPRYTFTRSQTIYGRPVETLEPYSQNYTSYILFTVLFYSIDKHLSTNDEHLYVFFMHCSDSLASFAIKPLFILHSFTNNDNK
jgi:hypothetical protein